MFLAYAFAALFGLVLFMIFCLAMYRYHKQKTMQVFVNGGGKLACMESYKHNTALFGLTVHRDVNGEVNGWLGTQWETNYNDPTAKVKLPLAPFHLSAKLHDMKYTDNTLVLSGVDANYGAIQVGFFRPNVVRLTFETPVTVNDHVISEMTLQRTKESSHLEFI